MLYRLLQVDPTHFVTLTKFRRREGVAENAFCVASHDGGTLQTAAAAAAAAEAEANGVRVRDEHEGRDIGA